MSNLERAVVFYPASSIDLGPLEVIAKRLPLERAVYCSFPAHSEGDDVIGMFREFNDKWNTIRHESLRERFLSGETHEYNFAPVQMEAPRTLSPAEFKCESWSDFWQRDHRKGEFGLEHSFGLSYNFDDGSDLSLRFDFIGAEAVSTYEILIRNGITPNVVVIQDHGMGTLHHGYEMGGEGLLQQTAKRLRSLPEFLCVETTHPHLTKAWPGYEMLDIGGRGRNGYHYNLFQFGE